MADGVKMGASALFDAGPDSASDVEQVRGIWREVRPLEGRRFRFSHGLLGALGQLGGYLRLRNFVYS